MLGLPVSLKKFGSDLKTEMTSDRVTNGAAALAYYMTLALFPALIFLLSLLPYLPIDNLQQAIMEFFNQVMPQQASSLLMGVVNDLLSERKGSLLSFGLLGTIWAATSGLMAIMQQLNFTYKVKETRSFFKARGVAFMLMVIFTILMITSFALIILGGKLQDYLAQNFAFGDALLVFFATLRWMIIFSMICAAFALIYYFGPDVKQRFKFISPGSLFGAIAIAATSLGLRVYVANFADYNKTYGSIGGVIVLMLWLYVSGLVLLVGAEINSLIEHYHPEGKVKGERSTAPLEHAPA